MMEGTDYSQRGEMDQEIPVEDPRRASRDCREEILVEDLDPENVVYPPDHEIESTPIRTPCYRSCRVCTLLACGLVLFLTVGVVVSHVNKQHTAGLAWTVVSDAPPGTSSHGHENSGGYVAVGQDGYVFTSPPVPAPSVHPASPPTKAPHKKHQFTPSPTQPRHEEHGCVGDHFDNVNNRSNNRLYKGQYICSGEENRYRFGLDIHANVIWRDMKDKTKVLYKNPYRPENQHKDSQVKLKDTFYLVLQRNGHLVLHWVDHHDDEPTDDTVVWTAVPEDKMELTEACKPTHDCPYMHMEEQGVLAVDWLTRVDEDKDGKYDWAEKNFFGVYDY